MTALASDDATTVDLAKEHLFNTNGSLKADLTKAQLKTLDTGEFGLSPDQQAAVHSALDTSVLGESPTTDALMAGKMMNAGQICLAPDYVFVPRDRMGEFVESSKRSVAKMYPTLLDNPDYTSVINTRHFERINGYVDEARERGVEVVEINPADEDFRQQSAHKIAPTLLIDPPEDSAVMQEEIFGPVMPIKSYDSLDETLDYVNSHDRPLGLYYFGTDQQETQQVLNQTTSGGVTLNDVVMHVAQEDLPFGGVGPSGMGAYHGEDGFRTFSHAKAVFKQATFNPAEKLGLRPPYGDKLMGLLKTQIK